MTLKQAVKALGGQEKAAQLAGVPRTTLAYWLRPGVKVPRWRALALERLMRLAASVENE